MSKICDGMHMMALVVTVLMAAAASALHVSSPSTKIMWNAMPAPAPSAYYVQAIASVQNSANITAVAVSQEGFVMVLQQGMHDAPGSGSWKVVTELNYFLYGVFMWSEVNWAVSGFFDGDSESYGVFLTTSDAGATWQTTNMGKPWMGPIALAQPETRFGAMLVQGGGAIISLYLTTTGGGDASAWVPATTQGWVKPPIVIRDDGYLLATGSSMCRTNNFGLSWNCTKPADETFDNGVACSPPVVDRSAKGESSSSCTCITGGGEIDPLFNGWVHISRDCGVSFNSSRALTTAYPIRFVMALTSEYLLALGDGGMLHSEDAGDTWTEDLAINSHVQYCTSVLLRVSASSSTYRILCVASSYPTQAFFSADVTV